jgi:predicted RNA binding protein YcfA (HicA-like mRNA interferase family)
MSAYLPHVRAKEIVRVAGKLGFERDRQTGSHAVYYRTSDRSRIVIPMHAGRDIKQKTLYGIIKDMGITPEQFKALLSA